MQRRILGLAVLASCLIVGPIAGAQGATPKKKVTQGVVYGGVTGVVAGGLQGYPVVIELNKAATKVVRANLVLDLACAVPPNATGLGDEFRNLAITRGAFGRVYGPVRIPADPAAGTPALDVSGSIAGRVNRTRTKITGTWSLKFVVYDPADPTGATVRDTCDSGTVRYTAKN